MGEVCGSLWVGRKAPEIEWLDDEIEVVGEVVIDCVWKVVMRDLSVL